MMESLVDLAKRVKRSWTRLLHELRLVALRQRFAPQISFVQARLSPQGYLGLHLTLGALVLIGSSWLFGGIAQDVIAGDPLTFVDVQFAQWLHAHATPGVTRVM